MSAPPSRVRVCFFVGPSVGAADFRAACSAIDADVLILPPAEQGDLLRLLADLPDVVGIVDGYFFEVPAILHKEILLAMERGARVLGAASLGALRAAELDAFGMEGVGQVYRLYKRGVIDGDDEVAVLHSAPEDGFRPLTESLVNIRHNLRRARARRVISDGTARTVLASAKRLYFAERTYESILGEAGPDRPPAEELAALRRFFREQALDLKREDALALVRTVAARAGGARPWPPARPVATPRTKYLLCYCREYVGRPVAGQHVPDSLVLSLHKLLSPTLPALYRRIALRCLAIDEAAERGIAGQGAEALLARFRRRRKLRSAVAFEAWLAERCLSEQELVAYLRERDLEGRLLAHYRALHPEARDRAALYRRVVGAVAARTGIEPRALTRPLWLAPGLPWDGPLLRELKVRGDFRPALDLAHRIVRANADYEAREPRFPLSRLRRTRLERWCAARWGIEPSALKEVMLDRGFTGDEEFDQAVRQAYAYERFGADGGVGPAILPTSPRRKPDADHRMVARATLTSGAGALTRRERSTR